MINKETSLPNSFLKFPRVYSGFPIQTKNVITLKFLGGGSANEAISSFAFNRIVYDSGSQP